MARLMIENWHNVNVGYGDLTETMKRREITNCGLLHGVLQVRGHIGVSANANVNWEATYDLVDP